MKRKWLYLVLTLLWFAAAALSAIQGRAWPAVVLPAVAGVLFGCLALGYHLCEQRGEAGREAVKKLQIAALAVAILVAAAALIAVLR